MIIGHEQKIKNLATDINKCHLEQGVLRRKKILIMEQKRYLYSTIASCFLNK
jgi:hypothetical protein